ncbi:cytochrome c [Arenibaculum sp.]|uniref:c-type cytochrome n=1 Tax=Arenibaculum sp. TaxID=2865862 RepID=UPI002E1269FD|nr:cytochrome c [Arenibaculum sp.]
MRTLVLLPLLVALVAACGTARRGPPAAELSLGPAAQRGELVFMAQCNQCHPGGEGGLGFALNNKPLPGSLIAFQVRNGLGAMPAFPETVISERELADLVAYLLELRRSPAPAEG